MRYFLVFFLMAYCFFVNAESKEKYYVSFDQCVLEIPSGFILSVLSPYREIYDNPNSHGTLIFGDYVGAQSDNVEIIKSQYLGYLFVETLRYKRRDLSDIFLIHDESSSLLMINGNRDLAIDMALSCQ